MNPGKFDWQVDVLVEHNKISAALRKEGDLSAALAEYRAGLDIAQSLADRDPDDMEWQRELLISHEMVGDVLSDQGEFNAAVPEYASNPG
jgi:hypothetical protein